MTPEEKAKELVDKFFKEVDYNNCTSYEWSLKTSKYCTLIAVDEIIKVAPLKNFITIDSAYSFMIEEHPECFEEYWQQVKEEIEKL